MNDRYVTRTGIEIGLAYVRPAPRELGQHAEIIQRVLLAKPSHSRWRAAWLAVREALRK
jgi:hypothetical protein